MYSYDERMKAVMLYIQYDYKVSVTVRELGYPSERTLRYWYDEYKSCQALHKGHRKRPNKYSKEKRQQAVEYYYSHGKCLASTVRQLGYPHVETLKSWIMELNPGYFNNRIKNGSFKSFSEEQKRTAVIAFCSRECSADTIANKIGVSRQQLYEWKNALLGKEVPASMKKHKENNSYNKEESLKQELSTLRKNIFKLQMEHDILKKANEILKKDQGINLQKLTNRGKTELIDALNQTYKLSELLYQLQMPRSSFYYQKERINTPEKYKHLRIRIKDLFEANKRRYGYRRINYCLKRL